MILLEEGELVDGLGDDFLPFLNPVRGQKELPGLRGQLADFGRAPFGFDLQVLDFLLG